MMRISICTLGMLLVPALGIAVEDRQNGTMRADFGFDLAFSAALPNDSRLEGKTISYALNFLRVFDAVRIGVMHEEGYYIGNHGDDQIHIRNHFNAFQIDYQVLTIAEQQVAIYTNIGHLEYFKGIQKDALAVDLGIRYDPWIKSAGNVTSQLGVLLRYRHCNLGATNVFDGETPVDDVGGFLFGLHGQVRF